MEHRKGWIFLILLTCFVWVVMVTFNGLAGRTGQELGIFKNSTGEISDVFNLQITPAGWTFSIWGFIYAWQALWLVYALSTICRRTREGHYIYTLPIMPPVIYAVYIINNLSNIAWLFVWDRQEIIASLVVIALTPLTLYICLYFSFTRLYRNLGLLVKADATKDIWLIRFLVQNGLAMYATWTTVATLLNVAMVMIYKGDVANDLACTIILGVLSFVILLWFVLDNFVFDNYTRYTFTPNIVFVVALAGATSKNYNLTTMERNSIFLVAMLSVASLLLLLKLLILVYRHIRKPINPHVEYEPTL